jgi:hypothetical protein
MSKGTLAAIIVPIVAAVIGLIFGLIRLIYTALGYHKPKQIKEGKHEEDSGIKYTRVHARWLQPVACSNMWKEIRNRGRAREGSCLGSSVFFSSVFDYTTLSKSSIIRPYFICDKLSQYPYQTCYFAVHQHQSARDRRLTN